MKDRAIFLDKDGTLIYDVPYNVDPEKIQLQAGVARGLRLLAASGYRLVVVSNQAGVARGLFAEEALQAVEQRLRELFASCGAELHGFYYCPHHPEGRVRRYAVTCLCRKPAPGLLFQGARELGINLAASWMVGDILNDIEAGRRVDCRTVLIDNGGETEWRASPLRRPHYTVSNFLQAAQTILQAGQGPLQQAAASPQASAGL